MEKKYQCECCKQMKRGSEFYKDNRRAFGLKLDCCKSCKKERYKNNKEKLIQYQLEWNNLNKDKVKEYMNRYLSKKSNMLAENILNKVDKTIHNNYR